jgi:hypothetical protein
MPHVDADIHWLGNAGGGGEGVGVGKGHSRHSHTKTDGPRRKFGYLPRNQPTPDVFFLVFVLVRF